uniref:RPGR interacting protein 1 n=1 Tax=Pelodiscus sinensis TaxID=13735 RepID=K7G285_PELSI
RATVRRNVGLIRLQRLLQEQSCELAVSRGRFAELHEAYESQLQQKQEMVRSTSEALLGQVEELTLQLKAERQKARALESQKQSISSLQGVLEEFQERIRHLEKERDLLKEDYDALLESSVGCQAGAGGSGRQGTGENSLAHEQRRGDVSRLEEQLSLVLAEKQQLAEELAQWGRLEEQLSLVLAEKQQLAEELAQERGSRAGGQCGGGSTPAREQGTEMAASCHGGVCIATMLGARPSGGGRRRYLHCHHAGGTTVWGGGGGFALAHVTVTRAGQAELQGVLMQAERDTRAHEEKQQKMEQLLDLRGTRIHQLEEGEAGDVCTPHRLLSSAPDQLKVLAYGGQLRVRPTECAVAVEEEKTPLLQSGESLLELHVAGAVLSQAALQLLGEAEPLTFCTYAFYDFETHCTPVVRGAQPRYCFTSQYVVRAEPLFLQYLQEAAARLNLHVATAADHRTLASCWLRFGERLGSGERVCATAVLHGPSGEDCGMLEYWMRLRPKALGYFQACVPRARAAQRSRQQELEGGPELLWNELQVQIRGCAGLRGRWLGSPPSPYVMYRFFTFPDHDTPIVPSSSHPYFGDLRTFPLRPTAQLNRYLRLESLHVYVFDDEDAEPGCYLGKAQIPLLPLARGHSITGDFVLTDQARHPTGSVSLSLEWKRPYLPPGLAWANENQRTSPMEQLLENGQAAQPSQVQHRPGQRKRHLSAAKSDSCRAKWGMWGGSQQCGSPLSRVSPRAWRRGDRLPWETQPASRRDDLEGDTDTAYSEAYTPLRSVLDICHTLLPAHTGRRPQQRGRPRLARRKQTMQRRMVKTWPEASTWSPDPSRTQVPANSCLHWGTSCECQPSLAHPGQARAMDGGSMGWPSVCGGRRHIQPSSPHNKQSLPAARVEACEPALDSDAQTTDSDEIVVGTHLGSPPKAVMPGIRIEIVSLRLHPAAEVLASEHVQQLYVEFHFPGVPLAETETPLSLRKPQSGEEIYFHFSKVILLDPEAVSTQRKRLFSMLQAEVAGQNWLQFVVGREPLPGTRGECEDVGFAYLDLREILLSGSDVLEQELEAVVSPQDHSAIGRLTVSVEAAAALRDIYWEGRRKAEE